MGWSSTRAGFRAAPSVRLVLVAGLAAALAVAALAYVGAGPEAPRPLGRVDALDVHALAIAPDVPGRVLFGHHHGVLESLDGGRSWRPLEGGPRRDAMSLAVLDAPGQPIYLAGHEVFLRSQDGGRSWLPVQSDLPGLDIHALAVSPTDPRRLYAFVVGHGLFRSQDGGATWRPLNADLPTSVTALIAAAGEPERLYAAAQTPAVLMSLDGGESFQVSNHGIESPVLSLAPHPRESATLLAGTVTGLRRSLDGGQTWTRLGLDGIPVAALAISPSDPDLVMVVDADKQVFRSRDGGRTWD